MLPKQENCLKCNTNFLGYYKTITINNFAIKHISKRTFIMLISKLTNPCSKKIMTSLSPYFIAKCFFSVEILIVKNKGSE